MDGLQIELSEFDLTQEERSYLQAYRQGEQILGISEVKDIFAKLVVRKIGKVVPDGWKIGEIGLKLSVKGSIPGLGEISGDANVKFVPE